MSRIYPTRAAAVVCLGSLLFASHGLLFGDDDQPAKTEENKPPAAAPEKPDAKDPAAEWKRLSERKFEIAKELQKLKAEFNMKGTPESRKKDIRDEFNKLISEYQFEIEAKMSDLAEAAYKADPENIEAAEIVMQSAFNNNQYQRALDIATSVIKSEKKSPYGGNLAINVAGAASFCLEDFEQAHSYYQQAKEKKQLQPVGGRAYHEQTESYIDFWKEEKEIRDREAKLEGDQKLPQVELTIGNGEKELGKVLIELFENEAPNTVANFISIIEAKDQNYNGVKFHRVVPNFVVQGGNLATAGTDKQSVDYTIKCECYRDDARRHFRGSLSMAHAGRDTGGSQFFITHRPTYNLNKDIVPSSIHTVFGRVTQGMDIVDQIKQGDQIIAAKVLFKRPHEYKPKTIPNEKPAGE